MRQKMTAVVYTLQLSSFEGTVDALTLAMKKDSFEHDNVRPHDACTSMSQLSMFGQIALLHHTCSPGFALFDYWLFGELRRHLGAREFKTPDMIEAHLQQFFASRPAGWYKYGFHKLPD